LNVSARILGIMVSYQLQPVRCKDMTGRKGTATGQRKTQSDSASSTPDENAQNETHRRRGYHFIQSPMIGVYRSFNLGAGEYQTEENNTFLRSTSSWTIEVIIAVILGLIMLLLLGCTARMYYGFLQQICN
ncbi:unnamed protein product, partial [Allacma fusca]